ncbi:MAG: hypothetical protein RBT63_00460 [Bdellovibrionales bacterium]|nr:hypothetical protein [Bdellovibrionales bacterium]
MNKPQCPTCGSTELAVERQPDGEATCLVCRWAESIIEFIRKKDLEVARLEKLLEHDRGSHITTKS